MFAAHATLCLLTFQFPSAVEQGTDMLWALATEDVERAATGRAALDFASGQGLYALLGRGQGEAQRAEVLLVAALSCTCTSAHLALASSLAGGVPEVPRGPAEDEAEGGQAEVAGRVEGEARGLLREEVAEDAAWGFGGREEEGRERKVRAK